MRLPNGRRPRLDWYGHNPFGRRFPRLRDNTGRGSTRYLRDINDIDTLSREVARAYLRYGTRVAWRHGRRVRVRYRLPSPRLWLSEWSISSDHSNRAFSFYVSRKEQARWLAAAYKMVRPLRYVAGLGWFDLTDDPKKGDMVTGGTPPSCVLLVCTPGSGGTHTQQRDDGLTTGLMTYDDELKPAFYAFQRAR